MIRSWATVPAFKIERKVDTSTKLALPEGYTYHRMKNGVYEVAFRGNTLARVKGVSNVQDIISEHVGGHRSLSVAPEGYSIKKNGRQWMVYRGPSLEVTFPLRRDCLRYIEDKVCGKHL